MDAVLAEDVIRIVWRRLWVIGLAALVFAASAVGLSFLQTPQYTASIRVVVGQENAKSANLGSDVAGLQQFTQTVSELVITRPVAEEAIQQLNLRTTPDDFLKKMSVKQVEGTQVLSISYTDTDPERAQRTANAIGGGFSKLVSEASPGGKGNAISATVWERAAVPDSPISPNPVRNGGLALMLGGMLGLALIFLLEYLDDRWSSPEEVEQVSGVPTFGVIRTFTVAKEETEDTSFSARVY